MARSTVISANDTKADVTRSTPGVCKARPPPVLVLGAGGWLGGTLAHTYGVRVAREARQEDGYRSTAV